MHGDESIPEAHYAPSGVVRGGKLSVIGNGVVLDPWALLSEIDKLAAALQDGRISRVVELDYPSAMILRWTETLHFDLVAMGKHGGRLGSVIRYVLHNSVCDVLIA